MSKIKQVLVLRKDLGMRKGKMAAQAAHGASMFLYDLINRSLFSMADEVTRQWLASGVTKICVGVDSEEELLMLHGIAKRAKLRAYLVEDAGLTELESGTPTCVAIGPDKAEEIDKITAHLKLL